MFVIQTAGYKVKFLSAFFIKTADALYKDLNTEQNDINLLCLFKFTVSRKKV